jgi:hypothetical protein
VCTPQCDAEEFNESGLFSLSRKSISKWIYKSHQKKEEKPVFFSYYTFLNDLLFILIRRRKKTLKGDKREREGGLIDLLMNAQAHTHTYEYFYFFYFLPFFLYS